MATPKMDPAGSPSEPGHPATIGSRPLPRLAAVAGLCFMALTSPIPGEGEPSAEGATSSRTAPRVEVLRQLVDLSGKNEFYLVVEPQAATVTLLYKGVVARRYPISSIEVGRRRIVFIQRPLPEGPPLPAWKGGRLDPAPKKERPTLSVDSQGQRQGPEPPLLPPTPEEAVPAPARYHILFDGGIELEVVGGEGEEGGGSQGGWLPALVARWEDFLSSLGLRGEHRVRVRLRMPPQEAASLYRGLPPDVSLVILQAEAERSGQALLR